MVRNLFGAAVAATLVACLFVVGCAREAPKVQSVSGVEMASVGKLETDADGRTVEQRNVIERLKRDNELGAVKHLYVISAYSGQVILYSPVRGKVTSGGKSLSPKKIDGPWSSPNSTPTSSKPYIVVGGQYYAVSDLPNEDGTYGSGSSDYIYWFTPSGEYHQHYLSGGQVVHVSDKPIAVKSVILNIESADKK